jgi:hypothetical protein
MMCVPQTASKAALIRVPPIERWSYFAERTCKCAIAYLDALLDLCSPVYLTTLNENPFGRRNFDGNTIASTQTMLNELSAGCRLADVSLEPRAGYARIEVPTGTVLSQTTDWTNVTMCTAGNEPDSGVLECTQGGINGVMACGYSEHVVEQVDLAPHKAARVLSQGIMSPGVLLDDSDDSNKFAAAMAAKVSQKLALGRPNEPTCFIFTPYNGTAEPDAELFVDSAKGEWVIGSTPSLLSCAAQLATATVLKLQADDKAWPNVCCDHVESKLNILRQHRLLYGLSATATPNIFGDFELSYSRFVAFIRTALHARNSQADPTFNPLFMFNFEQFKDTEQVGIMLQNFHEAAATFMRNNTQTQNTLSLGGGRRPPSDPIMLSPPTGGPYLSPNDADHIGEIIANHWLYRIPHDMGSIAAYIQISTLMANIFGYASVPALISSAIMFNPVVCAAGTAGLAYYVQAALDEGE